MNFTVSAAVGLSPPPRLISLLPALPAFVLTSILWTAWDPTYSSLRTAQLQGRDVRVTGKKTYIVSLKCLSTPFQLNLPSALDSTNDRLVLPAPHLSSSWLILFSATSPTLLLVPSLLLFISGTRINRSSHSPHLLCASRIKQNP